MGYRENHDGGAGKNRLGWRTITRKRKTCFEWAKFNRKLLAQHDLLTLLEQLAKSSKLSWT